LVKRVFDFVVSLSVLILLSPILAIIALWIKIGSPGPVLYRGVRVGRGGKTFRIMKFRTMVVDAEKLGGSSTSERDPRITAAGHALRRFKLDELPQFVNVLVGEMSLVGPRPQVQWAVDLYTDEERELLSVRPGITDYASLVFRNEGEILRDSADPDKDYLEKIAPRKLRLGLEYVRHGTLWTDIKLLAATAGAVLGADPHWVLPAGEKSEPVVAGAAALPGGSLDCR
jgi:lipopolysaccharide/colanic/teichoic acid biosynthesis glycosyltransferase